MWTPDTTSPRSCSSGMRRSSSTAPPSRSCQSRTTSMTVGSESDPTVPVTPLQTVPLLDAITEVGMMPSSAAAAVTRSEPVPRNVSSACAMSSVSGSRVTSARAVVAVQRTPSARRACPDLSAFQLDRVGRVGLHRSREDQRADDLLRPRTPGVAARRHVDRDHRCYAGATR